MNMKKGCGIGCLGLFSVAVILAGAATWYSRGINREYKVVQRSEKALLAATRADVFVPPADLVVDPDRLDAFLAVRDSLQADSQILTAAAADFARERDRNRNQGLKGFLSLVHSGSGLAPIYATYWSQRNRALLAESMSPTEYIWFYSLVYYKWLAKDPADGREANTTAKDVHVEITGDLPPVTLDLLAPRRLAIESTYHPELNPIELIFNEEGSGDR